VSGLGEFEHMIPTRFPLTDVRRQHLRDDRLWVREVQRMSFFNLRNMHCPCSECKGRRKLLLRIVHSHLIKNGRDPSFRVWKGPGVRDSSDEEWKNSGRSVNQHLRVPLDSHVNQGTWWTMHSLKSPFLKKWRI
jgi:hypothetical protein